MTKVVQVGIVAAEGGPLVIGDSNALREWRGIEEGGDDYRRACEVFVPTEVEGGTALTLRGERVLVWEMRGGGVADVFRVHEDEVRIVRVWTDTDGPVDVAVATMVGSESTILGEVDIPSGLIVVMWATESAEGVAEVGEGQLDGDFSVGNAALAVRCRPGRYRAVHDSIVGDFGQGRRCSLQRIS